ncbi:MAG: SIS domain-containing protein [Blastocatellia bacterium]|nr:SIS domain-containing protein [Blastocatellia bacterium]
MDALARLLALSAAEKEMRGLVHTPREILQQSATWRRTYQKFLQLAPSIKEFLIQAGLNGSAQTSPQLTVLLVGAGTSDYIGKSLCALLQKQWRCEVQAVPSTDLLTNIEEHVLPERSYLWISFSRSGDSAEGVAVLKAALERYPEVRHLIVTCNDHGKMACSFNDRRNVFSIVLDDEVNDRGLAMTSSFSNMVIVGQALAHLRDLETYGTLLDDLASTASQVLLAAADVCERLVHEGFSKVCFLGTGPLKGAATESALKVLELTDGRVMSFSESFLGLRHGPLSAIDRDTLVVSFLSGDERRRAYELDLVKEIFDKRLTAKRVAVLPTRMRDSAVFGLEGDTIVLGFQHPIADLYRPPVDVLVGQLLGLFASLREGLKPDAPSPQGVINRVVSHVTIH